MKNIFKMIEKKLVACDSIPKLLAPVSH